MSGDEPKVTSAASMPIGTVAPEWWLFRGAGLPIDLTERNQRWPPPPPWRDFGGGPDLPPPPEDEPESARRLGRRPSSLLNQRQISVVNAAIYLRRPLLVTGSPGSGKSSLAYLIARELGLGRVLQWPVTSRTTLRGALYDYDAIGRAQAAIALRGLPGARWYARARGDDLSYAEKGGPGGPVGPPALGDFVHLGPLGTALLPRQYPRVLLIDELDKSDFDLPNDLLNIFEDGEFVLPELVRAKAQAASVEVHTADPGVRATISDGIVRCHAFPIVIITSNGEREFPPAFLRRCAVLDIPEPDAEGLASLVAAHFPAGVPGRDDLVERFARRRELVGPLAADQLLNAAHLASTGAAAGDPAGWNDLLEAVWHRLAPGSDPG